MFSRKVWGNTKTNIRGQQVFRQEDRCITNEQMGVQTIPSVITDAKAGPSGKEQYTDSLSKLRFVE